MTAVDFSKKAVAFKEVTDDSKAGRKGTRKTYMYRTASQAFIIDSTWKQATRISMTEYNENQKQEQII